MRFEIALDDRTTIWADDICFSYPACFVTVWAPTGPVDDYEMAHIKYIFLHLEGEIARCIYI